MGFHPVPGVAELSLVREYAKRKDWKSMLRLLGKAPSSDNPHPSRVLKANANMTSSTTRRQFLAPLAVVFK